MNDHQENDDILSSSDDNDEEERKQVKRKDTEKRLGKLLSNIEQNDDDEEEQEHDQGGMDWNDPNQVQKLTQRNTELMRKLKDKDKELSRLEEAIIAIEPPPGLEAGT